MGDLADRAAVPERLASVTSGGTISSSPEITFRSRAGGDHGPVVLCAIHSAADE